MVSRRRFLVTSLAALGLALPAAAEEERKGAVTGMVTAKGGFEDKFEGLRSGADDYVVKPVDLKELADKVQRNLAARGSEA